MKIFFDKKFITLFVSLVIISFFSRTVFAVFYNPGDTLYPECPPSDPNCGVLLPLTANNINDTAYDISWDADTTHAPSKNAVYDQMQAMIVGGHNPVTIGATPNGLSLATQVLSLALASTSTTGALSSTDWNTFNNKQNALVSNSNIKTVNGVSLLGSGDITQTSVTGNAGTVTNGVYTNTANSMTNIAPLTTLSESWIGPSSTTGIYFKGSNVGIGTTTPKGKIAIQPAVVTTPGIFASSALQIYNDTTLNSLGQISFGFDTNQTNASAYLSYINTDNSNVGKGALIFGTRDVTTDTVPTERMRITSAGNISINTTDLDGTPAIGQLTIKGSTNDGTTNILVGRDSGEANVFSVNTNGEVGLGTAPVVGQSLFTSGRVGIGWYDSETYLTIQPYITSTEFAALNVYPSTHYNEASHNGSYNGVVSDVNVYDDGAGLTSDLDGAFIGGRFRARAVTASKTVDTLIGGQFAIWNYGRSGTFGNIYDAKAGSFQITVDGGTISNGYSSYISNPTGAGTITNNYGLYIENQTKGSTFNYAIYSAGGLNYFGGNVGIGMVPAHQLQLSTDDAAKPTSNTWTIVSDLRLKKNITSFNDGLSILTQINPVSYELNGLAGTPDGAKGIGVIAQDVEDIIPYTISTFQAKLNPGDTTDTTLYDFNSSALTFVTINAIKELNLNLEGIAGTLSTSSGQAITPSTETFITAFFKNIKTTISTWLADAGNGITSLYANVFNAKEKICVDNECLTKDDIRALLLLAHPNEIIIAPPSALTCTLPEILDTNTNTCVTPAVDITAASLSDAPSLNGDGAEGDNSSATVDTTRNDAITQPDFTQQNPPDNGEAGDSEDTNSSATTDIIQTDTTVTTSGDGGGN